MFPVSEISIASQTSRQPVKFHSLGNPEHWIGLTGWIRQSRPSKKMQAPSGWSVSASPSRRGRSRVNSWMKSISDRPRKFDMALMSESVSFTNPGHLQQFVQRWQA